MASEKYEDIIYLPHPTSLTHPRMFRENRAAQFSPFAALTGHEAAIEETARLTENRQELDEDIKEILDEKLRMIQENTGQEIPVTITYFVPDEKKSGGDYVSCTGNVKRVNEQERLITMSDGTKIPVDRIVDMESEL